MIFKSSITTYYDIEYADGYIYAEYPQSSEYRRTNATDAKSALGPNFIRKIDLKNNTEEFYKLFDGDFQLYNKMLYYIEGSHLYIGDIQGNGGKRIIKHVESFRIIDDYIYYYDASHVYKCNLDGSNKKAIASEVYEFAVSDGHLFAKQDGAIFIKNIETGQMKKIASESINSLEYAPFIISGQSIICKRQHMNRAGIRITDIIDSSEKALEDIEISYEDYLYAINGHLYISGNTYGQHNEAHPDGFSHLTSVVKLAPAHTAAKA